MKLKSVSIRKYKCFSEEQSFSVDPQVTVLVGKNHREII
jgi:recombinational DNA repair ATPase RecF